MENLEYIDSFFTEQLPPDQKINFEQRILEDPVFAEEVAFYVSAKKAASDEVTKEKKNRFRELYQNTAPVRRINPFLKIIPYAAAAAILGAVALVWFMYTQAPQPQRLADSYIQGNLQTLGVTMDASPDSMQSALRSYNEQQLNKALQQLEAIIAREPKNFIAKKNAGIVSLRTAQYDKALTYFKQLEGEKELFSNPAKFYEAVTYMKRNKQGDLQQARQLLEQVVNENMEGKDTAAQWLKQL